MAEGGDGSGMSTGSLQGILKWSLQHNDGTAPSKPVSEEERKWFFEALQNATIDVGQRMRMITGHISQTPDGELPEEEVAFRVQMLEELQDHVESIDAACDLGKIGGLQPLLAMFRSPHPEIRAQAAEVLATVVQNNPKAQREVLDAGALESILRLIREDEEAHVRLKGLLALGSLIRMFEPGQTAFRLGDGFVLLRKCMSLEEDGRVQRKAMQLARHLATSHDTHLRAMVELAYILHATAALQSTDRAVREAALGLVLDIARHVDFAANPAATEQLRRPTLGARLVALRVGLERLSDTETEAAQEERTMVDALLNMMAPSQ